MRKLLLTILLFSFGCTKEHSQTIVSYVEFLNKDLPVIRGNLTLQKVYLENSFVIFESRVHERYRSQYEELENYGFKDILLRDVPKDIHKVIYDENYSVRLKVTNLKGHFISSVDLSKEDVSKAVTKQKHGTAFP